MSENKPKRVLFEQIDMPGDCIFLIGGELHHSHWGDMQAVIKNYPEIDFFYLASPFCRLKQINVIRDEEGVECREKN